MSSAKTKTIRRARRSHWMMAAAIALAGSPAPAQAGNDDDSFQVTATVLAACEIVAQDLAFGDYDPIAASNLDAASTLSLTCTNGTPYELSMSLGTGPGATPAARYMLNGSDPLAYVLYRNAGRTQLWGQSAGSDTLAGTGTGAPVTIDVFGRIPMQQAVPAGAYEDTLTVTVTW